MNAERLKFLSNLVNNLEDKQNDFDAYAVESIEMFRETIDTAIKTGAIRHNELAHRAQISPAYLTDLRRSRRTPSITTMHKIVSALKLKQLEGL